MRGDAANFLVEGPGERAVLCAVLKVKCGADTLVRLSTVPKPRQAFYSTHLADKSVRPTLSVSPGTNPQLSRPAQALPRRPGSPTQSPLVRRQESAGLQCENRRSRHSGSGGDVRDRD